jgi:hypothetical protein
MALGEKKLLFDQVHDLIRLNKKPQGLNPWGLFI